VPWRCFRCSSEVLWLGVFVSCQLRVGHTPVCASSLHSRSLAASGGTRSHEEPGKAKGSHEEQEEESRGPIRSQGEPKELGGARKARRSQAEPGRAVGRARGSQEEPGGARRSQGEAEGAGGGAGMSNDSP